MDLFQELVEDIKDEYCQTTNRLGWRFLSTSKTTLEKNNAILLITLNPGGYENREDHPSESCENGCAYLVESWHKNEPGMSILQKQIQHLFKGIAKNLKVENYEVILNSSLCAHFIPFRSPNIKALNEKNKCIDFSIKLWRKILLRIQFKVIICIDKETYKNMKKILIELLFYKSSESEFETGWGKINASILKFQKNNVIITLVRLPHLSRFSIFNRDNVEEKINKIITEAFKDYSGSSILARE